ncbi:MAG: DUF11 domain-containing protein, partial [Anaerolineae bacterium]
YNLTVANQGPSFATNLVLTNTFAAGVSLDRVTLDQGTCSGAGTLVCNLGNLSPGSNVLIQFDVTVGSKVAGTLTNTARLSGGQTDPNQTNNIATEATTVTNPSPGTYYTFLPVVMDIEPKPVLTDLSVFNDNTGGDATFTVLGTGVSCTIPNNTTRFCGSFTPGTYTVQAVTVCGTGSKDITYQNGPVTTRLFCN